MSNQISMDKQTEILKLLARGGSIRGVARETGTAPNTVRSIKLRSIAIEYTNPKPKLRDCPICKGDYTSDFIFKHIWLFHAKTTKETRALIAGI